MFLLTSNAAGLRRDKSVLYSRTTIVILLYSVFIAKNLSKTFLAESIGLYGGLFHSTITTQNIQIFIFLISAIILQLTGSYPRKVIIQAFSGLFDLFKYKIIYNITDIINKTAEQYKIIEYPLIILFIITGAIFLISSSDIVSIFLSIELQSYGLYLLATLYRNSELSTSAGLTYFLLGGLSSCFIVLGTSLLYANSGTTNLEGYYIITSLSNIANEFLTNVLDLYKPLYINVSLIIMSVGFLFKMSAAPFHFWSPDVYDAIPTVVTTFVAIIAKISILFFLLELVHYTSNFFFTLKFNWTNGLLLSSLLSLIIGSVLGLSQFRIKRLYAYSTISHLGFILLALSINTIESVQAFIFYIIQYSISNLNAFILLISIGYSLYAYVYKGENREQYLNLLDKNNSPIQLISEIKGYFYINPVLALSLAITLFSFVGIPPLIGFFAKQMVLSAALDNGKIFLSFVAILTSVISAVYYLNVIKEVFFEKSNYKLYKQPESPTLQNNTVFLESYKTGQQILVSFDLNNIKLSSYLTITVSLLTLFLLLFIFTSNESMIMANILALLMFNP
uniref:NADH-ubiquinone oxidoreductase chain 2 n=1 Tax=Phaeoplaca camptidia TaxID=2488735 RepID=A0A8K1SNH5_9LECA|nr:NADH dehydrogenase subunit 2 [Phaeoplaca camptidia]